MKLFLLKVVGSLLIAFGEYLAIYSELLGVKFSYSTYGVWKAFVWITIAGVPLIAGYIMAYKGFGRIWPVSVVSVVAILLSEPVLNVCMLGEAPTSGAIIGFILGAVGLVCALTF